MRQVPVPTVPSSTEPAPRAAWALAPRRVLSGGVEATRDVLPLLRFRAAGLRGGAKRVAALGFAVIGALTVLAAWLPAYLPGAAGSAGSGVLESTEVMLLLPSAYLGVLVIAIVSSAVSGGGRELMPREQGVVFPVSPTTDHLGALLMAPLNIAWLL